jgi:glycosyltransferase involved in cell wall biosynthesis
LENYLQHTTLKKIIYILSNTNKALVFEWTAAYLDKSRFDLHFILLNPRDSEMESFLLKEGIPVKRIPYYGKKDLLKAIVQTFLYLKRLKPQILHAHLFEAGIIGSIAGWLAGIPKRVYTRHHSAYHHQYYPNAVKYDKLINFLATDIVAISEVVRDILLKKEHVPEQKIHLIHHGFLFADTPGKNVQLLNKYNPEAKYPVVGVISRYIELKGIQYILPAFKRLTETYPDALLIITNVGGNYAAAINRQLQEIPARNYIQIPFEPNVSDLYKLFDIFVHVPIEPSIEAFGQTYVEALAAGIPSIFTLSGVAQEFIRDRQNALVVPYKDSNAIYNAMRILLNDTELVNKLTANGKKDVFSSFSLSRMIALLEKLYTT